jgi:hypothetical protein
MQTNESEEAMSDGKTTLPELIKGILESKELSTAEKIYGLIVGPILWLCAGGDTKK